jgi:hypothetical protein
MLAPPPEATPDELDGALTDEELAELALVLGAEPSIDEIVAQQRGGLLYG